MFIDMYIGIGLVFILLGLWVWGLREVRRNHTFKTTPWLLPLGIFVWGDVLVLALFWVGWVILSLIVNNVYMSITLWALFWIVRSLGEIIYWLNQQFSNIKRNNPKDLLGGSFFGEGIWFVYQILWQCILIVMIFVTIWAIKQW